MDHILDFRVGCATTGSFATLAQPTNDGPTSTFSVLPNGPLTRQDVGFSRESAFAFSFHALYARQNAHTSVDSLAEPVVFALSSKSPSQKPACFRLVVQL